MGFIAAFDKVVSVGEILTACRDNLTIADRLAVIFNRPLGNNLVN